MKNYTLQQKRAVEINYRCRKTNQEKCFSIVFSPHPILSHFCFSVSEKHLNYKQLIF